MASYKLRMTKERDCFGSFISGLAMMVLIFALRSPVKLRMTTVHGWCSWLEVRKMFKIVHVWCLFRGSAIRLEILRKLRMTRGRGDCFGSFICSLAMMVLIFALRSPVKLRMTTVHGW